ncbi:MAG: DUF2779 domain-containing protein [Deltaproteobacteria bacterium]|nr:DUF2779 domain-containing protein [Deltaproteobacteria bacterium]
MAKTHQLSKSTFMRGLQCEKSLWLYRNRFDLQDEVSAGTQAIFDQGSNVGVLAHELFPGGVDLSPEHVNGVPVFGKAIARTAEAIRGGAMVLYEAAVVHEGVLVAVDILVRDGAGWKAYEVKSGTSAKDVYQTDAALQHWVLCGSGLDIRDTSIVHIDTSYVRSGDIDVNRLFKIVSVLEQARARQDEIGGQVARLKEVLERTAEPEVAIGPYCSAPYNCSFRGHCWASVPEKSVFDIGGIGAKAWQLYNSGVVRIEDVPSGFPLYESQRIEVQAAITGRPHIDVEEVRQLVASLRYPLCFLDFETVNPSVPLFDGMRPYQQLPFQYSLHRRDVPKGPLAHTAFLGDGRTDPRPALVEQLLADTAGDGSILTYSGFEKTQLNGLAGAIPSRADELRSRIARLMDLNAVFRGRHYYSAAMKGSSSIKAVLPALVPEMSYAGMEIAEGMVASGAYASLPAQTDLMEIARIRKALLDYCALDTLAMVRLLEVLERV